MSECNPASSPADPNVYTLLICVIICKNHEEITVKFSYREAIGSLLFLCSVSRPDISYAVNMLSRYVNNPSQQHVNAVKRVIVRYLVNTKNVCVLYGKSNDLIGYSDADFAGDVDTRKSNTGYMYILNERWASNMVEPKVKDHCFLYHRSRICCSLGVCKGNTMITATVVGLG
ncbi:unnamed protein product [Euphydryas editha]|uniref:Uncharacterized protein n=1 Tax=Euphydryas editha TaxID=104508 RepID=A0AAU9UNP2_EUPED|nr:unnamed protein product [Euphydryas editha]